MSDSFITKYRPEAFDEVVGHQTVIAALQRALEGNDRPHCYLLTGPSGTGKTTIARIIGKYLGAEIQEIDAASHSGVADMREIVELSQYMSLTGEGNRIYIIDECFAPGSQVVTPKGKISIENLSVGDVVIGAKGANRIKKIIKNWVPISRIIQLHLANGRDITCSEDHEFLSDHGWIKARDISNVESICTIQTDIQSDLLQMWDSIRDYYRGRKEILQQMFGANLPGMQCNFLTKNEQLYSDLLFEKVREYSGRTETYRTTPWLLDRKLKKITTKASQISRRKRSSQTFFNPHDNEQSNVTERNCRENDSYKNSQWNFNSNLGLEGREWERINETSIDVNEQIGILQNTTYSRIHNSNQLSTLLNTLQPNENSPLLQNRFGISGYKTSDRNRRGNTQFAGKAPNGLQERSNSYNARMDSISNYKQGDRTFIRNSTETCFFDGIEYALMYDLEVENHPSYNIEGLIVHNCHVLSKTAWQALLKLTEEPPAHFYVALCTTEATKVPATIAGQRAYQVQLKPLPYTMIEEFLEVICQMENWQVPDDVFSAICLGAEGSPRKALMLLLTLHDAPNREEVGRVLYQMDAEQSVLQLGQALVKGNTTWNLLKPILQKMEEDDDFENAFIQLGRYIAKVMVNTDHVEVARRLHKALDELNFPSASFDAKVRFYTAIGRIVWST